MFTNLVMGVYRNFLKMIQKKLKLKIGDVSFRCNRFIYQGMWERLQKEFPKLNFKVCQGEDTILTRNCANTA